MCVDIKVNHTFLQKLCLMKKIGDSVGTDKTLHHEYHHQYPRHIDFINDLKNAGILEIGLFHGASLNMWLKYFPTAFIYGLDIENSYETDRAKVFKGDQSKAEDLLAVCHQLKHPIYLIVDDGSHYPHHQIFSFSVLFQILQPGGVYVIEDIETSYWRRGTLYGNHMKYGYQHTENVVEKFKLVADYVNREFLTSTAKAALIEKLKYSGFSMESMNGVSSVSFSRNMIVIHKMVKDEMETSDREYRGKEFI